MEAAGLFSGVGSCGVEGGGAVLEGRGKGEGEVLVDGLSVS